MTLVAALLPTSESVLAGVRCWTAECPVPARRAGTKPVFADTPEPRSTAGAAVSATTRISQAPSPR